MSDRSDNYSYTYRGYEKTQQSKDTPFRMYKGLHKTRHFCHGRLSRTVPASTVSLNHVAAEMLNAPTLHRNQPGEPQMNMRNIASVKKHRARML